MFDFLRIVSMSTSNIPVPKNSANAVNSYEVYCKSKHGAQPLQMNSNICIITCSNKKTYVIKCCIIGKLVEVNEALIQNPKLLLEPPHRAGYLAIILPNIKLLDKMKESLLTQEQYDLKMLERGSTTNHLEISEICTSNTLLKNDLKIINKKI